MENRLSSFCDQVIEACWLVSAVVVPVFFNIFSSRVFEPDKLTLLRSIVLIMAAAWLIRYLSIPKRPSLSLRRFIRSSPLAVPVLILAGSYVLSTVISVDPTISFWGSYVRLQGLVTNLAYLTLFFITADRMRSRTQIDRLFSVLIVTSIPISIYGIIQHLQLDPLPWGGDVTFRVTSTMGNAIFLAAYLIMVTPLTLVRVVQYANKVFRPASASAGLLDRILLAGYAVVAMLQLLTILFTKSRGPWIGLGAGLFLMFILWLVRLRRRRTAMYTGALFVVCAGFFLVLNVQNSPLEPLKKISPYLERAGTVLDMSYPTNRVRTLIWFGDGVGRGAAGLIMDTPLRTIFGHGPETMYVAYGPYYPPDLAHLEARNAAPDRSHNDLLDYLVTMGFVGLFAYLLVMVRGFSVGLQKLWQEQDLARQGIIIGILGALASHVVESLTGIAIASTLTYTWLLLGCLAAIALMPLDERQAPAALAPAKIGPETRSARRRRSAKKEQASPIHRPPAPDLPWFRRSGFYVVVAYLVLTGAGSLLVLSAAANKNPNLSGLAETLRDPDPAAFVLLAYFWLLVGVLAAAVWVRRPQRVSGRLDGQTLTIAVVIGVVAILLPIKLFLGSIIGDMYFKKGLSASMAQRPDIAVAPYLEALSWSPNEDFYFLYLGQAYLDMARNSPTDRPAQPIATVSDLSKFEEPSVLVQLGRENLAQASLVALQRARELNPLNTDHSANLARLYRMWGEMSTDASVKQAKFAQSIDYYKQALSLSPNSAQLRAEWGLVYFLSGDSQQAMQQYQEAIRLDQEYAPTFAYVGDLYRSVGDDDNAIQQYQKALSVNDQYGTLLPPMDSAVHASLGEEYFKKGLFQDALQETQKVTQLDPKDYTGYRNLALVYRALNDPGKALDEARQALSLAPSDQRASLQALVSELQAANP